ncbi:eamA-like transporter family protein (plasmid) [Bacillus cereus]|nr:eamA-like transporter family protein [Bacillus cereus]AJI08075.1 eamA-like transporter family protein [Bacillus cereus G9241]
MYQALFVLSIKYTSALNASLLIAMSPIFSSLLAALHKQEKFSFKIQMGSLLSFIGAILILMMGESNFEIGKHSFFGIIMGIVASIAWGWYPILAGPLMEKYSPLRVTAWSTLIGMIPFLIYCCANFQLLVWPTDWMSWGALSYSIVFAAIFGLVIWYIGINKIGPTKVMIYMYLVPLFAVLFAKLTIGEQVNSIQVFGGVIILLGIYVVKMDKWTNLFKFPN